MRIISKFKDYYDGPSYSSPQDDLVYIRKQKKLEFNKNILDDNSTYCYQSIYYIGFCGKIYPTYSFSTSIDVLNFFYSTEEMLKYIDDNFDEHDAEFIKHGYCYRKWRKSKRYYWWPDFNKVKKAFRSDAIDQVNKLNIFEKYNVPIFSIHLYRNKTELILNCNLSEVQFFRKFNTFRTYQEISMYLGNGRAAREYVPEMDNKTKIEQHGFDLKESFRKCKNK